MAAQFQDAAPIPKVLPPVTPLVEFPLDAGGTIVVEVGDASAGQPITRGWRDQTEQGMPERMQESFQHAVERVRPAADALVSTLGQLTSTPDEITVEFAIQMSAQTGAFIATLGSTANFKVTLLWRSRTPTVAAEDG